MSQVFARFVSRVSPQLMMRKNLMTMTPVSRGLSSGLMTRSGRVADSLLAQCTQRSCFITMRMVSGASAGIHTNVDRDLVTFLEGEIQAEKEQAKLPKNGPGIPGFEIHTKGSALTLVKKHQNETVTIKCNVNGSVDTDGPSEEELEMAQANEQDPGLVGDMKARPDFVIEISKPDGQILAFNCRLYAESEIPPDQPDADKFEIEGFTLLNADDIDEYGDWDDTVYVGDAGIIDGQMYDLLMNFLDSRGVGNEFVDNLVEYATYYEHSRFINLLGNIKSFVTSSK